MEQVELYFDGYCPESLLKGQQVEMKLNEDDFWESEATGLQVSVFPPQAVILRWRGSGKLRVSSELASDVWSGLVMTGAQQEDGQEFFPDEQNILRNKFDLAWYIDEIAETRAELDAAKLNFKDPVFEEQNKYLRSIDPSAFADFFALYEQLTPGDNDAEIIHNDSFRILHEKLYDLKLIFDFDWRAWHRGWKHIKNTRFDYSRSSLLDISMYLTAIFRADRFNEGTIVQNIKNGTIGKILEQLRNFGHNNTE